MDVADDLVGLEGQGIDARVRYHGGDCSTCTSLGWDYGQVPQPGRSALWSCRLDGKWTNAEIAVEFLRHFNSIESTLT